MKRFNNILYVAQASADQEQTLARAVTLAGNNQARLTVMKVIPPYPEDTAEARRAMSRRVEQARETLSRLTEPHGKKRHIRTEVRTGKRFLETIRAVLREHYDLVIKPAENPPWIQRLFGSDDMHLLRKCPCPVWLMKPKEKDDYDRILAAVDFDIARPESAPHPLNREIVELAGSLALADFADLHLIHVWEAYADNMLRAWSDNPDDASFNYVQSVRAAHERALQSLQDHLPEWFGQEAAKYLSPRLHLPRGQPEQLIPTVAKQLEADLVVMGTVGRTGISGLLMGNTAEAILDQLTCSVLAIKPPGFVSPVRLDD